MTKKIKKTLKMGQKMEKTSPILKTSCYTALQVADVMLKDIFESKRNKQSCKSVLKMFKNGPKNIKNQGFFDFFDQNIQIFPQH